MISMSNYFIFGLGLEDKSSIIIWYIFCCFLRLIDLYNVVVGFPIYLWLLIFDLGTMMIYSWWSSDFLVFDISLPI